MIGPEIETLINLLSRMPGLGPRSARRAVLHLVRKRESLLLPLADALQTARESIVTCSTCGAIDTTDPCTICADPRRDDSVICVVEDVGDLWALSLIASLSCLCSLRWLHLLELLLHQMDYKGHPLVPILPMDA